MNLSNVIKVKVVSCVIAEDFEDQINDALEEGYFLMSAPVVNALSSKSNYNTRYVAMLYKTKQESI